ncbi:hypothetical protein IIA79_04225 [bacterium]|nr:hypothetical protein [bacterium]
MGVGALNLIFADLQTEGEAIISIREERFKARHALGIENGVPTFHLDLTSNDALSIRRMSRECAPSQNPSIPEHRRCEYFKQHDAIVFTESKSCTWYSYDPQECLNSQVNAKVQLKGEPNFVIFYPTLRRATELISCFLSSQIKSTFLRNAFSKSSFNKTVHFVELEDKNAETRMCGLALAYPEHSCLEHISYEGFITSFLNYSSLFTGELCDPFCWLLTQQGDFDHPSMVYHQCNMLPPERVRPLFRQNSITRSIASGGLDNFIHHISASR